MYIIHMSVCRWRGESNAKHDSDGLWYALPKLSYRFEMGFGPLGTSCSSVSKIFSCHGSGEWRRTLGPCLPPPFLPLTVLVELTCGDTFWLVSAGLLAPTVNLCLLELIFLRWSESTDPLLEGEDGRISSFSAMLDGIKTRRKSRRRRRDTAGEEVSGESAPSLAMQIDEVSSQEVPMH